MTFNQVLKRLKSKSNPAAVRGMARFGITAAKAYGWSAPALKKFAREIGKDHEKALNWAFRQIGKRNRALNRTAVKAAREIQILNSPSARWIASDALRELRSSAVQRRLKLERPVIPAKAGIHSASFR